MNTPDNAQAAALLESLPEVFFVGEHGELICRFDSIRIDFEGGAPQATFIHKGGDIFTLQLEQIPPGGSITLQGFHATMGVILD